MSRFVSLFCFILAPASTFACELQLHNGSATDLSVPLGKDTSLTIAPGDELVIPLPDRLWLDFGAEAHEYQLTSAQRALLCPVKSAVPIRVWAKPDGTLWLVSPKQQPKGFPLRPNHVSDLTGSPSNNSFKPKPLRGSA